MSDVTPPVTIDVQTPVRLCSADFKSVSNCSSHIHDHRLRIILVAMMSCRIGSLVPVWLHSLSHDRQVRTDSGQTLEPQVLGVCPSYPYHFRVFHESILIARPHTPSHQTPAMNVRESYLAKSAAAESPPSTSALWELHGPARPSSRQSGPNPAVSSPIGNTPGLPAAPSSPNLDEQVLTRVLSNGSIRSMGTYSRFDPTTYVDPAMFVPNAEPREEIPTRPASRNSALSYISENT